MALIKKMFICKREKIVKSNHTSYYYNRVGELFFFKDKHGKRFQRIKMYMDPEKPLVLFEDKEVPGGFIMTDPDDDHFPV